MNVEPSGFVKVKVTVLSVRCGLREPVTVTSSPRIRVVGDEEHVIEIEIFVKGDPLPEGEYTIDISLKTKEAGTLAFDVTDSI